MAALTAERLGVIGAGNMAEGLARGLIGAELIAPECIVATDPSPERRAVFADLGATVGEDNRAAAACELVLLALKPQVFDTVVQEAGKPMGPATLAISIAAGVRTDRIAGLLPAGVRIVRVMPNTPMLVGQGTAGVAAGPNATADDLALVLQLFGAAGVAYEVDESLLDAVTAVSGSGPAYVFRFVEALVAAGQAAGLPANLAKDLARHTVIGAAGLLAASQEDAGVLRERVTSPGGTTAAALQVLQEKGFTDLMQEAVAAAARRSAELA